MFDFDGIEIDEGLLERTNPIFNTAKMTLFQLAAAGNDDANDVVERLGLTLENTQNSDTVNVDDADLFCNGVVMEVRYFTNGKLAMESGFTEVDLPCGFTPRALEFAKSGKKFVGMDLPATINEVEPVIMSLLEEDQKNLVNFEGVDATNYQSLKSAFDKIEGKVCITTEGLLMYLTDSEMDAMCDNIKRILAEHGGCWITLDPEMSLLYLLIVKAFYGERTREIMWQSKYRIDDKSDVNAIENTITVSVRGNVRENMMNAINYIKSKGFKLERLPYADHVPEFKSLDNADPKIAAQIKEGFKKICIWKITVDESIDIFDAKTESFNADASIDGNRLNLILSGNLDTLSAPKLLANYEKIKKDNAVNSVVIDCSKLEYVSSAGLRVLLIMQNDCDDGVIMKSCNKKVTENLSNHDIMIV
ncbi:STAS domain-containing protein [Methanobrevibacter sp.]|uniref:STAS domain-containing protein n=1 Tax=Methanobrevibacter sp. TaxID=66852 RepID=UPI0025E58BAB|nr:STAS domain-containing protein [Methanobrevibacter sp.]MBQ6098851.1 anti-sigma factor antagonist [Methanobrevibacter sp.]MBQ6512260.1 anti-sigma factor antagonist [Methanobrevibacter sp.]MBQ6513020.1 anti-sigma factor antagonist [Methanobrevibacter sp.]